MPRSARSRRAPSRAAVAADSSAAGTIRPRTSSRGIGLRASASASGSSRSRPAALSGTATIERSACTGACGLSVRERRILPQDRPLELAQLRTRVEAELLVEQLLALAIHVQCLGLATRPVQRAHEERARPFLKRVRPHERLQLGDELGTTAEIELRLDATFDRVLTQLAEARRLRLDEGLVLEVGERRAPPERERRAQRCGTRPRVCARGAREQPLELVQVELIRCDSEHVAGTACLQHVAGAAQRLPERRDVDLDCLRRGARDLLGPERLREAVCGHDLVRVEQQEREQRPLPRGTEIE